MTAYVVKYTAPDSEVLDDLRSLANAIERGDLEAPLEGHSPLVRALEYVASGIGWEAWTTSYLSLEAGRGRAAFVSDLYSATRFATWAEAYSEGMEHLTDGETVEALPVES